MTIQDKIATTNSLVANRLKYVSKYLPWNDIKHVCDIGSWHMMQTLEFQQILPDCRYSVFEPDPRNYMQCVMTLRNLPFSQERNIALYNLALGDVDGNIEFWPVTDDNAGASSKLQFEPGAVSKFWNANWTQPKAIQVASNKLDTWHKASNAPPVDIIWIDVQGGEWDVFANGQTVLADVKCIFTEVGLKPSYQGQILKPQIDELLTSLGFVEIVESFEYNGSDCEANTIYIRKELL